MFEVYKCTCILKRDPGEELEIGSDPNPSILLTLSKKEANLPLIRVLFRPDPKRFFDPKGKKLTFLGEIFQTQTKDG